MSNQSLVAKKRFSPKASKRAPMTSVASKYLAQAVIKPTQNMPIQAKLTIGQPNDKYEQEADRVSDQVMRMSDADVAQRVETGTVQLMQIQRMCPECEGEMAQLQPVEEEEGVLQAKEMPRETPTVAPNLESRINSLKVGGQPLDSASRSFFEPRFGHDFSKVRLHTDSSSADTAKSINAHAFTMGNHVVMGSGEYQPKSQSGQRLLGHELTHVIQQGEGRTSKKVQRQVPIDSARQGFLNSASQCDTIIARAYARAASIMEALSAAYGNAYEFHLTTLRAQGASNQLLEQIILGAAITFITGGAGARIAGIMKSAKVGDFIANGVTDLSKAGMQSSLNAVLAPHAGGSPMVPMGENPRTWRVNYLVRVNSEMEYVLDILIGWKDKARNSDPNFFLNFDPVTAMNHALIRNDQPMKDIPIPDMAEYQRKFELGMWREWLQTYAFTVSQISGYSGSMNIVHENQGKKIRDRINELGENGDSWLVNYGGVAERRVRAEVRRRERARYEL